MISVYNKKEMFASERQLYQTARLGSVMTMRSFALFCVLDKIL